MTWARRCSRWRLRSTARADAGLPVVSAPQVSIFLSPGEHFVGDARHRVRTLLGSCVSITLWQPERRVGAMSHFLLAERGAQRGNAPRELDGRYGTEALQLMLQGLAKLGVAPSQCEAKLFGGGDMFAGHGAGTPASVGRRNGDAAHGLLGEHGIRLVAHSLFGNGHRKIEFDIATGDVWARQENAASDMAPLCNLPLATQPLAPRAPGASQGLGSPARRRTP